MFHIFKQDKQLTSVGLWFLCIPLLHFVALLLIQCKVSLAAFIYFQSAFSVQKKNLRACTLNQGEFGARCVRRVLSVAYGGRLEWIILISDGLSHTQCVFSVYQRLELMRQTSCTAVWRHTVDRWTRTSGWLWHPDAQALNPAPERQSARMSKVTNDGLTRSGTGCFAL